MDTNPIPQEQPTVPTPATPPQPVMTATPTTPPAPATPGSDPPPGMVLVQLPIWKNPRMYIAAVAAILIIAVGMFFSKGSGLKGSFDDFDATQDYKIQSFTITQPADGSLEIGYKIDKKASNLFMAITKPAIDDLPENDEMIKLIALSDADLTAGDPKVKLSPGDFK